MIGTAFAYLEQTLKSAGCKKVYRDEQEIEKQNPLPYAVILADEARLVKDSGLAAQQDDPARSVRNYRTRVFKRDLTIGVTIIHKDVESLGVLADQFLAGLAASILDPAGNAIELSCSTEKWVNEGSLLKGKVAIEIPVLFRGGVYREREVPLVGISGFEGEIALE